MLCLSLSAPILVFGNPISHLDPLHSSISSNFVWKSQFDNQNRKDMSSKALQTQAKSHNNKFVRAKN